MRDGYTRPVETGAPGNPGLEAFLRKWQVSIVVTSGDEAGTEFALEQERTTLGRGESADLCFADGAMSSEHAVLEFAGEGFRLRDLGSRNGTHVNGSDTKVAELKNGDRIDLGVHSFQFVLSERSQRPRTYTVPIS